MYPRLLQRFSKNYLPKCNFVLKSYSFKLYGQSSKPLTNIKREMKKIYFWKGDTIKKKSAKENKHLHLSKTLLHCLKLKYCAAGSWPEDKE